MNWLSPFIIANLIGIGSNLDNCGVSIAYGAQRIKLPHWVNAIINVIGFCTALLGTYAGRVFSHYIPETDAKWVACIVLWAIGLYTLYSAYLHPRISRKTEQMIKPQKPGFKQGIILGFALSFTNLASGFSATIAHAATIWATAISIMVWGYIMIWIGNTVAIGFIARLLGKYSSLVAGLLLMSIGLHQTM